MLINIYSTDFFRLTCSPTYNLPQGLEGSSKHSSSYSVPNAGVSEHSIQLPAEIHRCYMGKINTAQWTVPFYGSLRHCLWMIQGDPAAICLYISKELISLVANLANSKLDNNLSTQQLISVFNLFSPLSKTIFIYMIAKFSYLCSYFWHFLPPSFLHYRRSPCILFLLSTEHYNKQTVID